MKSLENIAHSVKRTLTAVGTAGLLYSMMYAHYQLPETVKAFYERGSATPSAMFRTEEVAGKALRYQDDILGRRE